MTWGARPGGLLLLATALAGCALADSPAAAGSHGERVAVSREDFDEKLRGRTFKKWSDFKAVLGPDAELEPEVKGEVRLMSGLTLAFIIILNVIVVAIVTWITVSFAEGYPRTAGWLVVAFLSLYGLSVFLYCRSAYEDPGQRVITNFLFGAVPLAVSSACYVLALLVLDAWRAIAEGEDWETRLFRPLRPWQESLPGRLIFFLAVLPGLAVSVYLGNTVSTGFNAAATHFDILSLCLFVDVGRFAGHLSYLLAREWSIGKSPDSITSRPGLCYVVYFLCLAWYLVLARLEAGGQSVILKDRTKIHTLACLTSYVFFPLAIHLTVANQREFFEQFEQKHGWLESVTLVLGMLFLASFMLMVGVLFDAIEPNLMGIATLLWAVFYCACKVCNSLCTFILALMPLAAAAFGAALFASQHAGELRDFLLAASAPGGEGSLEETALAWVRGVSSHSHLA